MTKSVVVTTVSELCRNRAITHIVMSPDTFEEYKNRLHQRHRRSGIRHATCHGVSILTLDGMRDDLLVTFNGRKTVLSQTLVRLITGEKYDQALEFLDVLLESDYRNVHTADLPDLPRNEEQ